MVVGKVNGGRGEVQCTPFQVPPPPPSFFPNWAPTVSNDGIVSCYYYYLEYTYSLRSTLLTITILILTSTNYYTFTFTSHYEVHY